MIRSPNSVPDPSPEAPVDVVVFTVIPIELEAALRALVVSRDTREKAVEGTIYFRGTIRSEVMRRDYSFVLTCIGRAGNPGAAAAISHAIATHRPRAVLLAGIAAGRRGKVRIGNVVLADRVVAYEPSAAVAADDGTSRVEPRPDIERTPHAMHQDVVNYRPDPERLRRRFDEAGGIVPAPPRGRKREFNDHVGANTTTGTHASGEKLLRDAAKFREVIALHGKIVSVDMEAAGLVEACRHAGVPWLVVRGISDFGDDLKDDRFQEFAAVSAAVVLADFMTHGLDLGPAPPPSASGKTSAHPSPDPATQVEVMRTLIAPARGLSRRAFAPDRSERTIAAEMTAASVTLSDGRACFIAGWSGRGKTTALHILATVALDAVPLRMPILLRFDTPQPSLFAHIFEAVRFTIPALEDEAAVHAWLQSTPTLLLIDEWHRLDAGSRRQVEDFATSAVRLPVALVIAGAPSIPPPRIPGIQHLELRAYSTADRDEMLARAVGSDFNRPRYILDHVPVGFAELLREPVILGKFVQAIEFHGTGGMHLPHNLPEFMDGLLQTMTASRHEAGAKRADELSAVCRLLAAKPGPILLEAVSDAMRACGVSGTSADVAEDLSASGVWKRMSGGSFAFEHTLWSTYFRMASLAASGSWGSEEGIAQWIRATDENDLRSALPFVSGFIDDLKLQDALFRALLDRSVELYLRTLATRADARLPDRMEDRARRCLEQLHRGYFDLIKEQFAGLQMELDPWSRGDGLEVERSEKPVVVGEVSHGSLAYYFGFAPATGPNVILAAHSVVMGDRPTYAPARGVVSHLTNLRLSRRREDSGRLLAAEQLFKSLEEILKKKRLPSIGWIARERFRDLLAAVISSASLPRGWPKWSVEEVRAWFEKKSAPVLAKMRDASYDKVFFLIYGRDRNEVALSEILALADILMRDGFASARITEFGLPGPDRERRGRLGAATYSSARRIERVRELYKAVATTYQIVCKRLFPGAERHFFFAQFPCRARILVEDGSDQYAGWLVWWEVVESWDAEPIVEVVSGRPSWPALELAEQARADCARFGRLFIEFSANYPGHMGLWGQWAPLVTERVCDLLTRDVARLRAWLANAT